MEVETIRLLLERLVEEPKVGAAEGRQVDQYLTDGSLVKGPIDIMRMVLEDGQGGSEDAALMVDEEGPEEEKVRNEACYGHTPFKNGNVPPYCRPQVFTLLNISRARVLK